MAAIDPAGTHLRSPYASEAAPRPAGAGARIAALDAPADRFAPSPEDPARPPSLPLCWKTASAPDTTADGISRKIVVGLFCGLSLFGALGISMFTGMPPASAVTPGEGSISQVTLTAADLAEAKQMGLSEATALKIKANPTLEATLRSIPDGVSGRYKGFNAAQRAYMLREITGRTHVGPFSVSNREAFVKGSVAGIDAFSRMGEKIDGSQQKGELTRREAEELKAGLPGMKSLTPAQRDALATVIVWDCASRAR